MSSQRNIEIISAGCYGARFTIELLAAPVGARFSIEMHELKIVTKGKQYAVVLLA